MTIRYTGERLKRLEDPRLLRGQARYLDDLVLPRMLALAFVRSPHACAAVSAIDAAAARARPDVVAVLTAADLHDVRPLAPRLGGEGFTPSAWPALASGEAHFAGEAVAAVIAATPYAAADGVEAVRVDWQPRPAVTALGEEPAAEHVVFRRVYRHGDVDAVFARAAAVSMALTAAQA